MLRRLGNNVRKWLNVDKFNLLLQNSLEKGYDTVITMLDPQFFINIPLSSTVERTEADMLFSDGSGGKNGNCDEAIRMLVTGNKREQISIRCTDAQL